MILMKKIKKYAIFWTENVNFNEETEMLRLHIILIPLPHTYFVWKITFRHNTLNICTGKNAIFQKCHLPHNFFSPFENCLVWCSKFMFLVILFAKSMKILIYFHDLPIKTSFQLHWKYAKLSWCWGTVHHLLASDRLFLDRPLLPFGNY